MNEDLSKDKIEELISKYERFGTDPSCPRGTTPLHFACDDARPEVVRELLSRGADPNARNVYAFTPLHVVAKGWGNVPCAALLLEAKADPDVRESNAGMTPLHWAAAKANVELVKLLLDHGADVSIRNDEGRTALEIVEINQAHSASAEKRTVLRLLKEAEAKSEPEHGSAAPCSAARGEEKGPVERRKDKKPLSRRKKIILGLSSFFILLVAGFFSLNLVYLSGKRSTVDERAHTIRTIEMGKALWLMLDQSVVFSADGRSLFTVAENYGKGWLIRKWDVSSGKLLKTLGSVAEYAEEAGYPGGIRSLPLSRSAVSPDRRFVAVGRKEDERIVFHDIAAREIKSADGFVLRYSNDGKSLAYGRSLLGAKIDQAVRLVDPSTGGGALTIHSSIHPVSALDYSPDGSLVALCLYDDPYIYVYDRTKAERTMTLGNFLFRHTDSASAVAFGKDGKVLASGSRDNAVKFWDLRTGKQLATIAGHPDDVQGLAFSPDGAVLAVVGGETLRLLRVPDEARK